MKNLSNSKIGDKLAVTRAFSDAVRIETVERVTKTLVITNGSRFNHRGCTPGESGYSRTYARPATDADILNARIFRVKQKLDALAVDEGNLALVEALLVASKQATGGAV